MSPRTLAKTLKRRQLRAKLVAPELVHSLRDAEILHDYMTCAKCGESIFANQNAAINTSKDVKEFLTLVNMALASHDCKKI